MGHPKNVGLRTFLNAGPPTPVAAAPSAQDDRSELRGFHAGIGAEPAWLLASRVGLGGGVDYLNSFAFDDRIGRVLDYFVTGAQTCDDLHVGSVILSNDYRDHMRKIAVDNGGHAHPFSAKDKCGSGHDKSWTGGGSLEVDLCQGAGHQFAGAVVHIDFDEQGTAGGVYGVRGADQGALVGLPGVLGESEVDLRSTLDGLRVELRQVGVDAQGLDGLEVEELLGRAGVDKLADVDGAGGDHAVKRRVDLLNGLQFAQALHVG